MKALGDGVLDYLPEDQRGDCLTPEEIVEQWTRCPPWQSPAASYRVRLLILSSQGVDDRPNFLDQYRNGTIVLIFRWVVFV